MLKNFCMVNSKKKIFRFSKKLKIWKNKDISKNFALWAIPCDSPYKNWAGQIFSDFLEHLFKQKKNFIFEFCIWISETKKIPKSQIFLKTKNHGIKWITPCEKASKNDAKTIKFFDLGSKIFVYEIRKQKFYIFETIEKKMKNLKKPKNIQNILVHEQSHVIQHVQIKVDKFFSDFLDHLNNQKKFHFRILHPNFRSQKKTKRPKNSTPWTHGAQTKQPFESLS